MADTNVDTELALSQEMLMELLTESKIRQRGDDSVRLKELSEFIVGLLSSVYISLSKNQDHPFPIRTLSG